MMYVMLRRVTGWMAGPLPCRPESCKVPWVLGNDVGIWRLRYDVFGIADLMVEHLRRSRVDSFCPSQDIVQVSFSGGGGGTSSLSRAGEEKKMTKVVSTDVCVEVVLLELCLVHHHKAAAAATNAILVSQLMKSLCAATVKSPWTSIRGRLGGSLGGRA